MQICLFLIASFALFMINSHAFQLNAKSSQEYGNRCIPSMLAVGDEAPDFELKNYQGKSFKLSSFKKKSPVVVFFYPSDGTPGCTTEVRVQQS